jgi:glycosyltransferase involved in cell wall biosynthesis
MVNPAQELRILHRKAIYPDTFGGNLRTLNIAQLARSTFNKITVFSMDNDLDYEGDVAGVHIVQENELHTVTEKLSYFGRAIFARELVVPYTNRAFINSEHSLFQIEDPLLYPLLKKKEISRFILDEQDVNWEKYGIPRSSIKQRLYAKIASRRDKENEKQALRHAAHVICCSHRDRDILINEVPGIEEKISVIPNCVNLRDYDPSPLTTPREPEPHKSRILFIGTLSYPPNTDAARLISQVIAPRSPHHYQFTIAGKNPPSLYHPENVQFPGYVSDLKDTIAGADICIAPIRFGSGTRLKILEYMVMGKPVISTLKGAEGIEYTDGLNIIIEDEIENYPEIIRQLLDDERRSSNLGREARKLIEEKYDWELYRKPLGKIYREASEDNC